MGWWRLRKEGRGAVHYSSAGFVSLQNEAWFESKTLPSTDVLHHLFSACSGNYTQKFITGDHVSFIFKFLSLKYIKHGMTHPHNNNHSTLFSFLSVNSLPRLEARNGAVTAVRYFITSPWPHVDGAPFAESKMFTSLHLTSLTNKCEWTGILLSLVW